MLFESIHLRNFLSFGPESQPVKLGPLNVLVGPNGSGKSNFIEGVSFIRDCALDRPFSLKGNNASDFMWLGEGGSKFSFVLARVNDILFDVDIFIQFSHRQGRFFIEEERLEREDSTHNFVRSLDLDDQKMSEKLAGVSILSHKLKGKNNSIQVPWDIENLKIYRDWVFGRTAPARLPQPSDGPADALEEDCSNLGMVLSQIKEDRKLRTAFIEHVRDLYPTIIDFDVRILPGFVQVTLEEEHVGRIPATRLSDGTLRYLCLLAILLNPTPPPLVCIEEPELGLHPDVQNRLARLMREASERMQIIVTTHSEAFVDALTDTPEALMVCERHNGSTVIERVDPERFAVWLQDHSLGELWRGGYIGGNRW